MLVVCQPWVFPAKNFCFFMRGIVDLSAIRWLALKRTGRGCLPIVLRQRIVGVSIHVQLYPSGVCSGGIEKDVAQALWNVRLNQFRYEHPPPELMRIYAERFDGHDGLADILGDVACGAVHVLEDAAVPFEGVSMFV